MQDQVRAGDVVARLGGDEYLVLLEPVDSQRSGVEIAERLVAALAAPGRIRAGTRSSIGPASAPRSASTAAPTPTGCSPRPTRRSTGRSRPDGRGSRYSTNRCGANCDDRATFETAVLDGLDRGEFLLHYQPIVDVQSQRVQGYEALVRWNRPGVGMVPPDQFIPRAETSNLIFSLDRWVLDEALRQLAGWIASGVIDDPAITMAVNISGRHISDPRIVDRRRRGAERVRASIRRRLVLEITETILIADPHAIRHLEQLREMGVSISIDDFGTGYNSIVQLQHLPVNGIKIDRSFVSSTHPAAARLLALIVQAAHAFGLPVVAEGVESAEQLSALRTADCESAQGYLFARPMTAAAIEAQLVASGTATLVRWYPGSGGRGMPRSPRGPRRARCSARSRAGVISLRRPWRPRDRVPGWRRSGPCARRRSGSTSPARSRRPAGRSCSRPRSGGSSSS